MAFDIAFWMIGQPDNSFLHYSSITFDSLRFDIHFSDRYTFHIFSFIGFRHINIFSVTFIFISFRHGLIIPPFQRFHLQPLRSWAFSATDMPSFAVVFRISLFFSALLRSDLSDTELFFQRFLSFFFRSSPIFHSSWSEALQLSPAAAVFSAFAIFRGFRPAGRAAPRCFSAFIERVRLSYRLLILSISWLIRLTFHSHYAFIDISAR